VRVNNGGGSGSQPRRGTGGRRGSDVSAPAPSPSSSSGVADNAWDVETPSSNGSVSSGGVTSSTSRSNSRNYNHGGYSGDTRSVDAQRALWNSSPNLPSLTHAYEKWWEDNKTELGNVLKGGGKFRSGRTAYNWVVDAAKKNGMGINQYLDFALGSHYGSSIPPIPSVDNGGGGSGRRGSNGGSRRGGGGGGGGSLTQNRTDTSYSITDPLTAKGIVTDTLSNYLGRNPTASEISSFTSALNAAERDHPTITNSTVSQNADGSQTVQSSVQTGGLDSTGKQQVLLDKLKPTAEYQAVQTDGVFRKALSVLANGGF
jgi:hypothetical protein